MALSAKASVTGIKSFNRSVVTELRRRQRKAISVSGEMLKAELRQQTEPQLGDRIAKAWRLRFYGMRSGDSPAAFLWSKAPAIVLGHARGATIVPVNGSEMIAIPTERVPRRRGRGAKARMTPEEVEAHFNQDFILRRGRKPNTLVALIDMNVSAATGKRRSRRPRLVHMFTFTPMAKLPRRLDIDAPFRRAKRRGKRILQGG